METDILTCPHCGKYNRVLAAAQGKPRCAQCHQWMPWIMEAGDEDFIEIVETSSILVIVDLWATWCGPCQMVSPAIEQLGTERAGQLKLVKVNVDKAPAVARQFAVQAVPTLLALSDHEVLGRQSGAVPVAALRNWLDQALTITRRRETRSRRR
jgi:thioredoxin 2